MKIALIAPFEESVPPEKYGGTELVTYNLIQELAKRNHKLFLIASGDSKTKAKLLPVFKKAVRKLPESQDIKTRDAFKFIGAGKILEILKNLKVDIVHNHLGWRLLPFSQMIDAPIITTLHGPLDTKYMKIVYGNFKNANYVSISNNQREPFPELNFVATVYNGIEVDKFSFSDKPGKYLAFLGRMSPEKGPIEAIKIAKKSGLKLKIAAKIDAVDKEYFDKNVKPRIDGKQIQFIGEINHKQKVEFLKNALCLLAPIQWREPFGLFFVESMACGTPVITFNRGSVPEIVFNGKNGFIVKDNNEAAKTIKKLGAIDRKKCRQTVEEKFSSQKMADGYEKAYEKVLKKSR
jgi:glycosyltransferase involved in cell wall biosynthesis